MTTQPTPGPAATVKPGYRTTEGWLSLLAFVLSGLVALKWVPLTVSNQLQQDAVLAVPGITGLYAIARAITKHGARPGLLPWVESLAAEILPAPPAAPTPSTPATVTTWPPGAGSTGGTTPVTLNVTPPTEPVDDIPPLIGV